VNRECHHIRDVLDSYLSGELLIETNHLVLHHLETCSSCRTEAARRQRTRALLAQSLDAPADVEPLRRRITDALDRQQRRGSRAARYWATAAVVAAGLVMSFWFSRRVDAAAYSDSVTEHVQCGLTVPASATYNPRRIAARLQPPFTPMAEAVVRTSGKYELVDAHTCPLNGRQYAHLVYRGDGHVLSVFAEPALRGVLPAAPSRTLLEGTSIDVYASLLDGYRVTATSTHDHHIFVITDDADTSATGVPADLLKSAVAFVRKLEK
jgi:anti-sigma factor RsiW